MERVEPLHNESVTDQPTDTKTKDSSAKEIKAKNRPGILLMTGVSVLTSVATSIISGKLAGASKTSELVDGVAVSAVVSGAIAGNVDLLLRSKSTFARVATAIGIGLGAGAFGGRSVISKEELEQMVESISPEA